MHVIGTTTTYDGTRHPYLRGYQVRVIAVLRYPDGMSPDLLEDVEYERIEDDDALNRSGGLRASDLVEVQPWIENEGRFSWVSSDAWATELECFQHLRTEAR